MKSSGAEAGVAINPATPVATLSEILHLVDMVLVMSVNPGFGGQKFIPYTLDKVRSLDRIRQERGLDFRIEIDGGLTPDNVAEAIRAGVEWVVAGNSVYGSPDPAGRVELMSRLALEATLARA
jgi:ribulose-phosphate 3-epimerase